jgi:hypothetical protein
MCSIKSIRLGSQSLNILKGFFSLYTFGVGCMFCGSTELQQAYGLAFAGYGVQLIFAGMISFAAVFPQWYANKRHNRFLLAVVFTMDMIVLIIVAATATTMGSYVPPLFSKSLQLDCLRNVRQVYTEEECMPFLTSPRTAGFRLFWYGKYSLRADVVAFQAMSNIQGDVCCGFFAPLGCVENTENFPSEFSQANIKFHEDGVGNVLGQQVYCGPISGYYPQTDICLDYYKSAQVNPIVGGCNWDLGVGFCTSNNVFDSSIGCASAVEDYVGNLVSPQVSFLLFTDAFVGLAMLYSCCMLWKRREEDVFPEIATNKVCLINERVGCFV